LRRNFTPSAIVPFSLLGSCGAVPGDRGHRFVAKERFMPIGAVKFFNYDKGYGFISNDAGGPDSFVHVTAVEAAGLPGLKKDERVSYDLEPDRNGKTSAVNLLRA
jgi:CspA family cold shock protein